MPKKAVATRRAPIRGWNTRDPLESMPELDAPVLTNWIPAPGGLITRPPAVLHTSFSVAPAAGAGTLMEYAPPGGTAALFAAYATDIYNVTAAGAGSIGASVYGGGALTSKYWSHTMLTSAANSYLFMVNGADSAVHWNGTTWTNPVITNVTSSTLRTVTNHKSRLWFTVGTLLAWYLPNNSVAGAASSFDLGPLAKRGGHLVNIATWTRDGGLGPDDYIVFLTSKGEAIVYAGTDPSSASTWGLVGTFQLPPPVGRRCMVRVGADLIVMTVRGLIPMSQAMTLAESGLGNAALTAKIAPTFETATQGHTTYNIWQFIEWPREKLLICNIPVAADTVSTQYVMQTETMGWCNFDFAAAASSAYPVCFGLLGEDIYFGDANQKAIYKLTTTLGAAPSATVNHSFVMSFQPLGGNVGKKRVTMTRASMLAESAFRPYIVMNTDYSLTAATASSTMTGAAVRNVKWMANQGFGHVFAPALSTTITGSDGRMTLNTIDIMYEEGGPL